MIEGRVHSENGKKKKGWCWILTHLLTLLVLCEVWWPQHLKLQKS